MNGELWSASDGASRSGDFRIADPQRPRGSAQSPLSAERWVGDSEIAAPWSNRVFKMKLTLTIAISLLACSLHAQQPWSEVVLAAPFHIGDSKIAGMKNLRPDGRSFRAQFTIPASIPVSVATLLSIEIQEADLSPFTANQTAKRPGLAAKLLVNGNEIAILNHLVRDASAASKVQTLWIRVPASSLRSGINTMEIAPGVSRNQQDDLELHRIVVSNRVPPK